MTLVKLIYDEKEVLVNREKLAESCEYFKILLDGDFKESNEYEIEIYLDPECISFELFKSAIDFAVTGELIDDKDAKFYAGLIQLAHIWLYDHMIQVVEEKLLEFVDKKYLPHLHTLGNFLKLPRLIEKCEALERHEGEWANTEPKPWPSCSMDLHKKRHHYSFCNGTIETKKPENTEEENWDELSD